MSSALAAVDDGGEGGTVRSRGRWSLEGTGLTSLRAPERNACQLPRAASFLNFTDGSHRVQDGALDVLPEHCLPASSFSRPPRHKWPHRLYQPHHNFRLSWSSCIFPREWKVLEGTHHFWVFTSAFSYFWMNGWIKGNVRWQWEKLILANWEVGCKGIYREQKIWCGSCWKCNPETTGCACLYIFNSVFNY